MISAAEYSPKLNKIASIPYFDDDYDEQYEEYYRQYEEEDPEKYEEEDYEDPSCSTSGRGSRNDVDSFSLSAYDQTLWQKSTSIHGQMFNGRNSSSIPWNTMP